MENFDIIRQEKRLIYEYIRGSHLYNLQTETSDIDTGGMFLCHPTDVLSLHPIIQQVSDEKNDNTWYEIGFYLKLLLKSNVSAIEALYVPNEKILTSPHSLLNEIFAYKNQFLTKKFCQCLLYYARNQIYTATSLKKKISNPIKTRLKPLDFVYTFYNQGSMKISQWLDELGLKQKYCGLVNINNMHDTYGVYYDWAAFFQNENISKDSLITIYKTQPCDTLNNLIKFILDTYHLRALCYGNENQSLTIDNLSQWYQSQEIKKYKGIINENDTSNELKLSSIVINDIPICYVTYNQEGYSKHCREYLNYKEWETKRNQVRFTANLKTNYDAKNMMHCFRLLHMGLETVQGEGLNLERTWDRDFLLNIKKHSFEYEDLLEQAQKKITLLEKSINDSSLQDDVDINLVNDILINIRKKQLLI